MNPTFEISDSFDARLPAPVDLEPDWAPPLRIWHVGASGSPRSVNGVNTVIWDLASRQSRLGHRVHLILVDAGAQPGASTRFLRNILSDGIHRHVVHASSIRFASSDVRTLLAAHRPDVVHIHSAFVPRHTLLGRQLAADGIPYVLTPHGALLPQVLERGRLKKKIFTSLLERQFVRDAAGVTALTGAELASIQNYSGGSMSRSRVVFNPIELDTSREYTWTYRSGRPSILFLGRFDVEVKGLDRLMEIARFLPEADFHLYGRAQDERGRVLPKSAPRNVHFHGPVYGDEKAAIMIGATLYFQPSRWEAFPLSATEAMSLGVPCAMSENLHLARLLAQDEAIVAVPADPKEAAACLSRVLSDADRLGRISEQGRTFVREYCSPIAIARQYVGLYREILREEKGSPHLRKL